MLLQPTSGAHHHHLGGHLPQQPMEGVYRTEFASGPCAKTLPTPSRCPSSPSGSASSRWSSTSGWRWAPPSTLPPIAACYTMPRTPGGCRMRPVRLCVLVNLVAVFANFGFFTKSFWSGVRWVAAPTPPAEACHVSELAFVLLLKLVVLLRHAHCRVRSGRVCHPFTEPCNRDPAGTSPPSGSPAWPTSYSGGHTPRPCGAASQQPAVAATSRLRQRRR